VPCELCWFQRIFAYPIAVLAIAELIRHARRLREQPGAVPERRV
jgi:disulfide bond formation protein DsbB